MSGYNYNGSRKRVFTWGKGDLSWDEHVSEKKGTNLSCQAQLIAVCKKLADIGKVNSKIHFNSEGDDIYAIKAKCGLRAYGWFGTYNKVPSFVIGWVVHKKKTKLDPGDKKATLAEKKKFESQQTG